ncbi:RHS repeat-associated core domain-containing protein [Curtobacterium sp. L1-20]|uniref:RHS repeat-associated core domain-containing protein n=1 Tax=Curtobacterium sp. L1-20 TaxID=3138181 RepID=UPI003B51D2DE
MSPLNKLLHQVTDGGSAYDYTYGTIDQNGVPVIANRTVAGAGTASVISDPTTGQPLDLQTTDGTTSMWILDGTGSPAAAIADTGKTAYTVSYAPYGAETVGIGSDSAQWQQNPYGFKTGLRSSDDNGMTEFGYRWQTSGTGGWIQRDTLDAPLSPTNANRYAYAGDDPINSADPTGNLSSFGTYADACGSSAVASAGIDLALAATGPGVLVGAGVACVVGVGTQFIGDEYGQGAGNGVAYIDFLLTVGKIGSRFV